jgi:hypothetical protein
MARLSNFKHEAFAQAVAGDAGLSDAYEHAGFVRRRGNPNRLARHPKVAARITELQSHICPTDVVNLEYIQAKLREICPQIPAAVGNRDAASRLANDLRRIATALNQHAGHVDVLPPSLQTAERTEPAVAPFAPGGPPV